VLFFTWLALIWNFKTNNFPYVGKRWKNRSHTFLSKNIAHNKHDYFHPLSSLILKIKIAQSTHWGDREL